MCKSKSESESESESENESESESKSKSKSNIVRIALRLEYCMNIWNGALKEQQWIHVM